MSIHPKTIVIRNVLSVIIVAGLVAFMAIEATGSVTVANKSRLSDQFSAIHPLDRAHETLVFGEPNTMP